MIHPTCITCFHWDRFEYNGTCHLDPPTRQVDEHGKPSIGQPTTRPHDWCSHHQPATP
jgi:hypothetical protein